MGFGFRVEVLGLRVCVQGLGLRVQGLGVMLLNGFCGDLHGSKREI